jgi:hypothetical protein
LWTYNNAGNPFHDGAWFISQFPLYSHDGDPVGGFELNRLQFFLLAPDETTVPDLELPSLTDLGQLWQNNIAAGNINFMAFSNASDFGVVRYSLSTMTAREISVPEPSSVLLLSCALLAAGLARTPRRR